MMTDDEYAYIEPGDHVELYDERGVSIGISRIVDDPADVTFWPTQEVEVHGYCVAGGNGVSVIGSFDVPQRVRPRLRTYITIDPVLRLRR